MERKIGILFIEGSLVVTCFDCKKDLASRDCPFPWTRDEHKPLIAELSKVADNHKCKKTMTNNKELKEIIMIAKDEMRKEIGGDIEWLLKQDPDMSLKEYRERTVLKIE